MGIIQKSDKYVTASVSCGDILKTTCYEFILTLKFHRKFGGFFFLNKTLKKTV